MLRRRGRARHLHPEDAVSARSTSRIALLVAVPLALVAPAVASCAKRAPAPSAALEGRRDAGPRARRDAAIALADEEEEREDLAAYDAGINLHALPCAADRDCMTHRCDTAVKRCRFPCRSDDDCNPGARCDVDAGALAACFTR